jgi:1-acyl-sn-glycerol-3-phosphate acyltransferase
MIRTLWFYFMVAFSTLVHATTALVAALFRVPSRPGRVYDWSTSDWSRWILAAAGTRVVVEGSERIPTGVPVIYACNHASMFDIWALSAALPGSVRFVAKAELARIPFFGAAMVRAGHVSIERENKAQALDAYRRAADTVRSGISTVVFPEGTRSRTGELLPFKNAPFGLAIAAGVPLVPLFIHGTFGILPKGRFRLEPATIHILVGEPITTEGLSLTDRQALRDRARAAMVALAARVDAAPAGH